jgi:hypothetical protein
MLLQRQMRLGIRLLPAKAAPAPRLDDFSSGIQNIVKYSPSNNDGQLLKKLKKIRNISGAQTVTHRREFSGLDA